MIIVDTNSPKILPFFLFFLFYSAFHRAASICVSLKILLPGIEDGQTVRMPLGKKELFVTFRVEKSDYFKRDGADVHTEAEISISQALLGGTIRIQGLYEDHTIQVSSSALFIRN